MGAGCSGVLLFFFVFLVLCLCVCFCAFCLVRAFCVLGVGVLGVCFGGLGVYFGWFLPVFGGGFLV